VPCGVEKSPGESQWVIMVNVAIIGLGMMGSSLGLALKRAGGISTTAYARRPETRADALRFGVATAVAVSPAEAVSNADIVVLCTPILSMEALLRAIVPALKPGALVTDVGSTKAELMRQVGPLFKDTRTVFIGSHPMAGSEKTGIEAGRADLYDGATIVLTPSTADAGGPAVAVLQRFWEKIGGRVLVLDPDDHDRIVARTSHLPQLAASLLALTVGRDPFPLVSRLCGNGFRDSSRLAASSPEMWHDIIKSNQVPIRAELEAYRGQLDALLALLDAGNFEGLRRMLDESRSARARLFPPRGGASHDKS
jgi:prephenate dehydrogenase